MSGNQDPRPLPTTAAAHPELLSDAEALEAADSGPLEALMEAAARLRDQTWGHTLTFSPKVFLPLTNLCRNHCNYCSFRKSPGEPGEWTMSPDQLRRQLDEARDRGCVEALLCLGDKPDLFPDYRRLLRSWGQQDTVGYLRWAGQEALKRGLLPHTNAGILTTDEMRRLKTVNVSLGLMLESTSERLCARGGPHWRAPDKRPRVRLEMTRGAGELKIPFTSGLLLGIGESGEERVQTLLAIRELHREGGHIQEVIVQNFRAGPSTPMASSPEPQDLEVARSVALARLILPPSVSVQAPPNLNPQATRLLIQAGINDFGGISPVTPDYINPGHPWPHLQALEELCQAEGFQLRPRLPIYPGFVERPGFLEPGLREATEAARRRLDLVGSVAELASRPIPGPETGQRTPTLTQGAST